MKQVKPQGPSDYIKLCDAIEKIRNYPAGYDGTYSSRKDDHGGIKKKAAFMIEVKGGKFVMAK